MPNNNTRWIIAAIGCFLALAVPVSFAKSPAGHSHSGQANHSHSGQANSQTALPAYANSWPYLRAENGIFGPTWAAPGPGSTFGFGGAAIGGGGFGGIGYGGYGGIIPGWGYGYYGLTDIYPGGLPYFSLFPPVYYDYADGAIAPKSSSPSAGAPPVANTSMQSAGDIPPPPLPGPHPLRIANPYYSAGK